MSWFGIFVNSHQFHSFQIMDWIWFVPLLNILIGFLSFILFPILFFSFVRCRRLFMLFESIFGLTHRVCGEQNLINPIPGYIAWTTNLTKSKSVCWLKRRKHLNLIRIYDLLMYGLFCLCDERISTPNRRLIRYKSRLSRHLYSNRLWLAIFEFD